jgi:hypothetical protein
LLALLWLLGMYADDTPLQVITLCVHYPDLLLPSAAGMFIE